jgi:MoaA/NifB/PqqE/SkfB family radical SAM enzyme
MMNTKGSQVFNSSILGTFRTAKNLVSNTTLLPAAVKAIKNQRNASKRREQMLVDGLQVPPMIIYSVTKRCNLRCVGCYHHAQHRENTDISSSRIRTLLEEASELGISIIVLAGGEPLMRKDLLDIVSDYPEIIFPVFTNGVMIDEKIIDKFRKNRHIVPIISIEGLKEETDNRRGTGIYSMILERFQMLDEANIFYGVSITVTQENLQTVTDDMFVRELCEKGVQVMVYVEYVPVETGTENFVLTIDQREKLEKRLESLRRENNALFINFPGDEKKLGGCLAAGRGFLHISQDGSVEPCPASPFSDTNIKETALKDALTSKFLKTIRDEPHSLENSQSGCALFDKETWVRSLIQTNESSISNSQNKITSYEISEERKK